MSTNEMRKEVLIKAVIKSEYTYEESLAFIKGDESE